MKKALLFLVFLVSFVLTVACGGPRESKEETDASQVTKEVKKPDTEFTVVEEESEPAEGQAEDSAPAQSTNSTEGVGDYAYKCVNKDNATCSNHIQVPLFTTISLTLSDVDVGGVKLAQLPLNLTFMIHDKGLERIIKEIPVTGRAETLIITKEVIWKRYGNTRSEEIIRTFLRDKNLAFINSLNTHGWENLLDKLQTEMRTNDSPIIITRVSSNLSNLTIRVPVQTIMK